MSKQSMMLFVSVYLLVGMGIVMTYSASAVYAEQFYQNPFHFLYRQLFYAILGTALLYMTASIPVGFWKRHSRLLVLIAILLLLIVYLPVIGRTAGGAQRWINLGFFNFQPAEYAKIAVFLYLADYLSRKHKQIKKGGFKIYLPPLTLIGIVCALILMQPDLGSCAFILLIAAILLFWAGLHMKYVLWAALAVAPVFYLLVIRVPYRFSRISAYLNPWDDPQGSGFQIIQSFLAYGLGGIKGVGLGQGMQKLFYLPSSYNDFILSVIGEELGLLGILFVMGLYAVIFIAGLQLVEKARQDYDQLFIISMTLMIVIQALINMLVTTGLVPTKGLPLPFVSFGGTSIVFNLMAVGLLLAMDKHLTKK